MAGGDNVSINYRDATNSICLACKTGTLMNSIQKACLFLLRPIAKFARSLLVPQPDPICFAWQQIKNGPASGLQIFVPTHREISDAIIAGTYEETCIQLIDLLVSPDDIGGHYGYFTLSLATFAHQGQVHCFEPVPKHAKNIQQAVDRSGYEHIQVHQVAVAGETGEMSLRVANAESHFDSMGYIEAYGGANTDAAHENHQYFDEIKVQTVTLDSLDLPVPQFIKIDTEGAEAHILRSGLKVIAKEQPRMLIEMHSITAAMECAHLLMPLTLYGNSIERRA